jgi:hypothetical protein
MAQSISKASPAKKTAAPPKKVTAAKAGASKASIPKTATPAPATPAKTATRKTATAKATVEKSGDTTKAPAKKVVAKTAAPKGNGEARVPRKPVARRGLGIVTPEQRYRMICDAAYFRAERRGFVGGNAVQDWLDAESEIDGLLREMQE